MKKIRNMLTVMIVFVVLTLLPVAFPVQAEAAPVLSVSNKKITLKKAKKKKIKITLNRERTGGLQYSIKDSTIVSAKWSGWKRDTAGRSYIHLTLKGKKNGTTKITIRENDTKKKIVLKVTVKGFKETSACEKLKKYIMEDPDDPEVYAGKTYTMRCIALDPSFLRVGYCSQDGTFVFNSADLSGAYERRENKIVTMIYNPKDPAHTVVEIEENGEQIITYNDYAYSISGILNAATYKDEALFPYTIKENYYYDSSWYATVKATEMSKDSIDTSVKYTFAGAMINFDNALDKIGLSMKELGFKNYGN